MTNLDRILLMLGLFACNLGQVQQQDRYFEVLQATSQEWMSGVPGGGRRVTYRLQVKIKTNKPIQFEAMWLAGKKLIIKPEKGEPDGLLKSAKNEVVTLRAADHQASPGRYGRKEEQQVYAAAADTAKAPVEYEGAALLKYVVDGAPKYCPVAHITVLPPILGQ